MFRLLAYGWAFPTTCLGLLFVPLSLGGRGRVQVVCGVMEIHGPWIAWLLKRAAPIAGGVSAMTLGHVVIARDQRCLDSSRQHERVHVRQCERWGPLFIPAYLIAGLLARVRGGDPYFDNPFEREASRGDLRS
jgi:hypothetical protein